MSPMNATPPAVVNAAVSYGKGLRWRHRILPVRLSIATNSPRSFGLAGWGSDVRFDGPVPPRAHSGDVIGAKTDVAQLSFTGI